jgi:hypothetical protein
MKVADYKAPYGLSSHGSYSLRPECWKEFDPYHLHFTPQARALPPLILPPDRRKNSQ